jgi:hypothetical protein
LFSIIFTSGKISISINIIAAIKFGISIAVAENLTEKKISISFTYKADDILL